MGGPNEEAKRAIVNAATDVNTKHNGNDHQEMKVIDGNHADNFIWPASYCLHVSSIDTALLSDVKESHSNADAVYFPDTHPKKTQLDAT